MKQNKNTNNYYNNNNNNNNIINNEYNLLYNLAIEYYKLFKQLKKENKNSKIYMDIHDKYIENKNLLNELKIKLQKYESENIKYNNNKKNHHDINLFKIKCKEQCYNNLSEENRNEAIINISLTSDDGINFYDYVILYYMTKNL